MGSSAINSRSRTHGRGRKAGRGKGLKGGSGSSGNRKHNKLQKVQKIISKKKLQKTIDTRKLIHLISSNEIFRNKKQINLSDLNFDKIIYRKTNFLTDLKEKTPKEN